MTDLNAQIVHLQTLRKQVAGIVQELASLELEGRQLRLTIEVEKRQAGSTKTDAERDAKVDPRYLAHERQRIQRDMDRAVLEADCEALAYGIRLSIATLERVGV